MRLSKRTEYGLRALVHLARLGEERYVQSKDLAGAERLPGKYVELVLMSLRRAGLLKSRAGVGGGYQLAKLPAHIRIADVIEALQSGEDEDSRTPPQTPGEHGVRFITSRLEGFVSKALGDLTLEKLLDHLPRNAGSTTGMYYI